MITGPELDLLQEVLAEDPTADVYLDVAHALLDRGDTRKAATVLRRALEYGVQDLPTARLLAQTAGEIGDDRGLRVAAQSLGEDAMKSEPVLARAYAIALDRAGDLDRAGELARSLIDAHGSDPVLEGILERRDAPLPDPHIRARDPLFTVRRAESYLESGRPDLAVRAYRRILAAHPHDQTVHARLLRLRAMPREARPWVDDLSEEYWVGRPMSAIDMPAPTLVPEPASPDDEVTVPGVPAREFTPGPTSHRVAPPPPPDAVDEDEEATTVMRPEDVRSLRRPAPRLDGPADDADEEATIMMSDLDRRELSGRIPGVDALREAIEEDRELAADDEDAFDDDPDPDADSIIEQARAIEQRAADRRRRSLFRK